jgi:hypothetical protein
VDERRTARLDHGLLIGWVALSLLGRRYLPLLPIRVENEQDLIASVASQTPGALTWWPLLLFAAGLPLAASAFRRDLRRRDRRRSNLAFAFGVAGFLLLVVGLSLNLVEMTLAGASLETWETTARLALVDRFQAVFQADQLISALCIVLLAAWLGLLSWISIRPAPPLLPAWFGWAGVMGALVTAVGGLWGTLSVGALRTLDGGDALLLVHLWIGLVCTLMWDRSSVPRQSSS